MSRFCPDVDYDYEDTPRFWASQEQEKKLIERENNGE